MKRVMFLFALMMLASWSAQAGVNANGSLVAIDPNLLYSATNGSVSICGQGNLPTQCSPELDTRIDGANSEATAAVWKVYAAFSPASSPRLLGVTWGVHYASGVVVMYQGPCGNLELSDSGWPASDTGCSVAWNTAQTASMIPVYWFAGYSYASSASFSLQSHPSSGGYFWDDSVPSVGDAILGYGALGFDQNGSSAVCGAGQPGACCFTQVCLFLSEIDCSSQGGAFKGSGYACDPNPCPGACCSPSNGSCSLVLQTACLSPNVWHPEWTTCSPNPCPPVGACCSSTTGACTLTTQANCVAPSTWLGSGTSCMPNPCPQPLGACCLTTTCVYTQFDICLGQGGNFQGSSEPCNPNPCDPSAVQGGFPGPGGVALGLPVPNPSMGAVQYSVVLPRSMEIRVSLLDISGRLVRELLAGQVPAGTHAFIWDPRESGAHRLPSGLYTLRLEAGGSRIRVRSLILLR